MTWVQVKCACRFVRAHAQICACARTFQFCPIEEIERRRRRRAANNAGDVGEVGMDGGWRLSTTTAAASAAAVGEGVFLFYG